MGVAGLRRVFRQELGHGERMSARRRLDAPAGLRHPAGMSTLTEIEEAIATLPVGQVEKLAVWLETRRRQQPAWPVPPPDVERAELERIEAEFPTLRG